MVALLKWSELCLRHIHMSLTCCKGQKASLSLFFSISHYHTFYASVISLSSFIRIIKTRGIKYTNSTAIMFSTNTMNNGLCTDFFVTTSPMIRLLSISQFPTSPTHHNPFSFVDTAAIMLLEGFAFSWLL